MISNACTVAGSGTHTHSPHILSSVFQFNGGVWVPGDFQSLLRMAVCFTGGSGPGLRRGAVAQGYPVPSAGDAL